jgi:hypothetical protein
MVRLQQVTLDVLKPHEPSILELANALGAQGGDYQVRVRVAEMDEKTETLEVIVTGTDVDLAALEKTITTLGGSVHSIDEVLVSATQQQD